MDNQPQINTPQSPVPPTPPQAPTPPAPQPPIAPPQPAMQPPAANPYNPVQPAKASKKLWIGLGIGVAAFVILLVGLLLTWLFVWSPAAQAARLSNTFMHRITTGDVSGAVSLTGDATAKDFLSTASNNVHGSYTLQQYEYDNGTGFALYDLKGANENYGRVIVAKANGKFIVRSFVYSKQPLAIKPAATTADQSNQPDTSTATTAQAATSCLGAGDFTALNSLPVEPDYQGLYGWYDNVFFQADSAAYQYPDQMGKFYDKYKTFYQQNATKQFTITIQGEVYSASRDDALASQRATEVLNGLETQSGIPASRLQVKTPTNNATSLGAGDSGSENRNVSVTVVSADSCATKNK